MQNSSSLKKFLKTGIFIFTLSISATISAQPIAQGNNICTLCDPGNLKIYYPLNNSYLLVEQPDRFIRCTKDSSEKTLTTFLSNGNGIYFFDLDSLGEFDLYNCAAGTINSTWKILQIYDVDKDGNNDIIANSKEGIYWFRNNLQGKYSKVKKLANPLAGINSTSFSNPVSGVMVSFGYDKHYSTKVSILDVRIKDKPKIYNYSILPDDTWSILFGGDNSIDKVVVTESRKVIAKTKWCTTNFARFTPGYDDEFAIADFNNDGYGDIVNFSQNKTTIGWGNKDKILEFGNDLMQIEDSIFLNRICEWDKELKYRSYEEVKNTSLDRLSSGSINFIDLNSDGFQDFVWIGEYIIAFQNNTKGGFDRYFAGGPYDPDKIRAIDLNGDKLLDMVVNAYQAQYVLMNLGNGFKEIEIYNEGYQDGLIPIDLDNDKDLDVMILGKENVLWSENDHGNFKPAVIIQK